MKNIVIAQIVVLLAYGCGPGRLSEDEARRLVEGLPDYVAGVSCNLPVLRPLFVSDGVLLTDYFVTRDCGDALREAGLATVDECGQVTTGFSRAGLGRMITEHGCELHWATPAVVDGSVLRVPCGSVRVLSVHGITTSESSAVFTYERELQVDPRWNAVAASCRVELPAAGLATRERTARRDDEGTWSLVTATP